MNSLASLFPSRGGFMNMNNLFPAVGGRSTRKNARKDRRKSGIFSAVASPFRGLLRTATNVAASGLDTVVDVPVTAVRGVKNTVRNSVKRLSSGVNNIVHKTTAGVNSSIRNAVKSRKNRKDRKNSRKN